MKRSSYGRGDSIGARGDTSRQVSSRRTGVRFEVIVLADSDACRTCTEGEPPRTTGRQVKQLQEESHSDSHNSSKPPSSDGLLVVPMSNGREASASLELVPQ